MPFDLAPDIVELAPAPAVAAPRLREMTFRADAWLPQEDAELRRRFALDERIEDIADAIGRKHHATRSRITVLGLRRNSMRPWLPEEDAELVDRYGDEPAADIARDLGRSVFSVYVRAQLLKLTQPAQPAYTPWEDAQIRAGYAASVPVRQIGALIGRSMLSVCCRASLLGVRHPHQPPNWTDVEMARALELAEEGHRYLAIIEMLVAEGYPRRSKSGFGQRIRILGYGRGWGRDWTPDEDELLRRAYAESSSLTGLGAVLGRSKHSLKWRAEYLQLQGSHGKRDGWRGRVWTPEDEALLRAEFGKTSSPDLAAKLGRSKAAMFSRAHTLGLQHGYIRMFSADERRAIGIVWRLGLPLSVLAEALDRDPAVISKHAIRLGIAFDSPDRPVQPNRGVRKQKRPAYTLAQLLELMPVDSEFDARLEAAADEMEARASRNRSLGASKRAADYRASIGLSS